MLAMLVTDTFVGVRLQGRIIKVFLIFLTAREIDLTRCCSCSCTRGILCLLIASTRKHIERHNKGTCEK
jgi:hypothetical protein